MTPTNRLFTDLICFGLRASSDYGVDGDGQDRPSCSVQDPLRKAQEGEG